jgi:hypothetical protein
LNENKEPFALKLAFKTVNMSFELSAGLSPFLNKQLKSTINKHSPFKDKLK